jgi:hypothetical protein
MVLVRVGSSAKLATLRTMSFHRKSPSGSRRYVDMNDDQFDVLCHKGVPCFVCDEGGWLLIVADAVRTVLIARCRVPRVFRRAVLRHQRGEVLRRLYRLDTGAALHVAGAKKNGESVPRIGVVRGGNGVGGIDWQRRLEVGHSRPELGGYGRVCFWGGVLGLKPARLGLWDFAIEGFR